MSDKINLRSLISKYKSTHPLPSKYIFTFNDSKLNSIAQLSYRDIVRQLYRPQQSVAKYEDKHLITKIQTSLNNILDLIKSKPTRESILGWLESESKELATVYQTITSNHMWSVPAYVYYKLFSSFTKTYISTMTYLKQQRTQLGRYIFQ